MSTKEKLRLAALELFSEHGYAATSTRDICRLAGVNSASIGYHFGDKRSLYRAVLKRELEQSVSLQLKPLDGPAEARLRQIVEASLEDIAKFRDGPSGKLSIREITNPSEDLMDLLKDVVRRQFAYLLGCVRELAPPGCSEEDLLLCCLSVLGQLQYYRMFHKLLPHMLEPEQTRVLVKEKLVDHITTFSIAAIANLSTR